MRILGMGVPELVIILIVALLIFGPKNLPKLGSALGKTVKNLRDGMGTVQDKIDEDFADEEAEEESAEILALEEGKAEEPEAEVAEEEPEVAATPKKTAKKVAKKKAE